MTLCAECKLAVEERAAILEYEAGMPREEAEEKAAEDRCGEHLGWQKALGVTDEEGL